MSAVNSSFIHRFLLFLTAFVASLCVVEGAAWSKEPVPRLFIKYVTTYDGIASGVVFKGISALHIDRFAKELYILDTGNGRVVVLDLHGIPLFSFPLIGIPKTGWNDITVDRLGRIYISGGGEVVVFNYRGKLEGYLKLKDAADGGRVSPKALDTDSEGNVYVAAGLGVLKFDSLGNFKLKVENTTEYHNFKGLTHVDDGYVFLDPGRFKVVFIDEEGTEKLSFGKVSSLMGGFSLPSDMVVDEPHRRIVITDGNRSVVMIFNYDGRALSEFGGTRTFSWPGPVVVDDDGRIYVSDRTSKIRVFEVIEEKVEVAVVEEPVIVAPEPEPEPVLEPEPEPVDEVSKMVKKEQRLLPVYFAYNSWKLTTEAREILFLDTQWIEDHPEAKLNIRGYADPKGSDAYNMKLSERRAKAVMGYFAGKGIDMDKLIVVPIGESGAEGLTDDEKAELRRVDFLVVLE